MLFVAVSRWGKVGWQTGSPKPQLEYQKSDSFLKKQFKYCARGEIGYFAPKHIVSALPEEGERPTKSHRKFIVDDLDEWYDWFYGPSIVGRKPPLSETTLLRAERNAWRQIYQPMADGATLKPALKTLKDDQLFWSREVYERIIFQQLRPQEPKGAKERARARDPTDGH